MSNGYLVAAAADLSAAHEIADGFGLDVIDASSVHDQSATSAALATAANVGLLLSAESARDDAFVALLSSLATQIERAQLILVTDEARAAFTFLPEAWPAMTLEEARSRSNELIRRRQAEAPPADDAPRAEPLPPAAAATPARVEQEPEQVAPSQEESVGADPELDGAPSGENAAQEQSAQPDEDTKTETPGAEPDIEAAEPPAAPPSVSAPQAPPQPAPAPPIRERREEPAVVGGAPARSITLPAPSAPADATAFAPGKLRRGTPELVRIVVHQPKDLNAVIKAAKKLDPRTESAPQGMPIGDVALGASIGVALEVRGGACDGALQRRTWAGEPIDFNFAVEADASVKQVVLLARVFINDAQIGVLAFTRKVSGPGKKPHGPGDRARLRRHKRVFLSYSSQDRETVSAIATAYQMAGVEHFWDRASLKSGEEWHPRLRREIDRADLFHLCWSKSAAGSEWVQKEAEHALTRRRKNSGKPEITVQMLDGPPWAPHPSSLDAINFDDFVRAAIVGYARGDGS
ncbi:MAG TPA: toll/interleukin-1 receptor domain-containing protein [Candidatus Binatia bacterium]|nr:toll/interleukin-1 receptor domain-containing protein [Candidatus Binatia bacterium]